MNLFLESLFCLILNGGHRPEDFVIRLEKADTRGGKPEREESIKAPSLRQY